MLEYAYTVPVRTDTKYMQKLPQVGQYAFLKRILKIEQDKKRNLLLYTDTAHLSNNWPIFEETEAMLKNNFKLLSYLCFPLPKSFLAENSARS